jgi:RNA polymerase sigma factor (sigma-70 family)
MSAGSGTQYLDNYLNEIGQVALLTAEQEIELSKTIQEGNGSAAAQAEIKLIEANLRLVVSVAKRWQHTQLPMEELISAGNEGLQIAAKKFNPLGFHTRFSTYATLWIEQAIRMAANRAHTVRIPIRRATQLHKVLNAPSYNEAASQQDEHNIASETGLKVNDVRHVLQHRITEVISLDAPAGDGSGEAVSGAIPEERCLFQDMMDSEDLAVVRQAIAECLSDREQFVIRQRFGLDGPVATLDAVGEQIGRTRERVRKIELQALARLRQRLGEIFHLALDPA